MEEDHRPWGFYSVLAEESDHKIKRIVVYPGQRLSLQRHRLRAEHWYIVRGIAIVKNGENEIIVQAGDSVDIALGAWHRISNQGDIDVVFVEVQRGDYLGEDDIERAEDDYGRAKPA